MKLLILCFVVLVMVVGVTCQVPEMCRCEHEDEDMYDDRRRRRLLKARDKQRARRLDTPLSALAGVSLLDIALATPPPTDPLPTPSPSAAPSAAPTSSHAPTTSFMPSAAPSISAMPSMSAMPTGAPTRKPSLAPLTASLASALLQSSGLAGNLNNGAGDKSATVDEEDTSEAVEEVEVEEEEEEEDDEDEDDKSEEEEDDESEEEEDEDDKSEEEEDDSDEDEPVLVATREGFFMQDDILVLPRDDYPCNDFDNIFGRNRMLRSRRLADDDDMFECGIVFDEDARLIEFDDSGDEVEQNSRNEGGASTSSTAASNFEIDENDFDEVSSTTSSSTSSASNGSGPVSESETVIVETYYTYSSSSTYTYANTVGQGSSAEATANANGAAGARFGGNN